MRTLLHQDSLARVSPARVRTPQDSGLASQLLSVLSSSTPLSDQTVECPSARLFRTSVTTGRSVRLDWARKNDMFVLTFYFVRSPQGSWWRLER